MCVGAVASAGKCVSASCEGGYSNSFMVLCLFAVLIARPVLPHVFSGLTPSSGSFNNMSQVCCHNIQVIVSMRDTHPKLTHN